MTAVSSKASRNSIGPVRRGRKNSTQRSKDGCFCCRLRRKRCDMRRDERGHCETCSRLRIQCLGWGDKRPAWMRDKAKVEECKQAIKIFLASHNMIRGQVRHSESPSPEGYLQFDHIIRGGSPISPSTPLLPLSPPSPHTPLSHAALAAAHAHVQVRNGTHLHPHTYAHHGRGHPYAHGVPHSPSQIQTYSQAHSHSSQLDSPLGPLSPTWSSDDDEDTSVTTPTESQPTLALTTASLGGSGSDIDNAETQQGQFFPVGEPVARAGFSNPGPINVIPTLFQFDVVVDETDAAEMTLVSDSYPSFNDFFQPRSFDCAYGVYETAY